MRFRLTAVDARGLFLRVEEGGETFLRSCPSCGVLVIESMYDGHVNEHMLTGHPATEHESEGQNR